jgi:hypothetical protein
MRLVIIETDNASQKLLSGGGSSIFKWGSMLKELPLY